MIITSTTIVQLCSKLGALSSNQANLATDDFLNIANIVQTSLVAELLGAREEYLTFVDTLPVAPPNDTFRIPYRAVNGTIRHLWFEDPSGLRTRLHPKSIEDMEDYQVSTVGTPTGFYVSGNNLVLLPTPNVSGSLIIAYPFRPNLLVDGTICQSILALSSNAVIVPNMPSSFGNGILYDIIDHTSGNGIVYYDLLGSISGTTVSFTTPIPNAKVGNYIARAGTAPVPMFCEEGHPLLLEMTVMRVEMVRGNVARIKNSAAVVQDIRKGWELLLNNRIVSKAHPAGSGGAQRALRPW